MFYYESGCVEADSVHPDIGSTSFISGSGDKIKTLRWLSEGFKNARSERSKFSAKGQRFSTERKCCGYAHSLERPDDCPDSQIMTSFYP